MCGIVSEERGRRHLECMWWGGILQEQNDKAEVTVVSGSVGT